MLRPPRICALQTYNNVLHVYGLHTSKESLLPSLGQGVQDLCRVRSHSIVNLSSPPC